MGLSGQVAVVTGGAKGFGAGITAALCERGASVWATGRRHSHRTAA
jgi:NAD(P)-dependent dehydrogenase (short-subunit alcohol dehydrogenase family)